ncbi:Peroxiredoxin [Chthonomonas calidirosea]|uniref:thioredoxin-dependent thiol peroxidase n=1 Tax=Chthonomonas calidirosea TaxID=454171 RepID=UPI0006DD55FB|nr:thioredoxin-dependent thiol peroxidase [Chthonomonas calidirosea]CEK12669.1 Peroxiredoxin [Chthonomonas calidirosea]CEK12670.1 Peroxiredoxin [Chthonomonas calidirosea]
MLKEGDLAPDFTLPDQEGHPVTLSDLRGRTVVLFFYPRADTPGCTAEACGFRDMAQRFRERGIELLGISPDAPKAQAKFAEKYQLPMRLLADTEHKVAELYGVWVEKKRYGRTYMGVERQTFVIGPDGRLTKIFQKVKPEGHAAEVLSALT